MVQKNFYPKKILYSQKPRKRIVFNEKDGSLGEQRIRKILTQNLCNFVEQKTFDGLKDQKPLRFDFSLEFNGKVVCLIEYQGEQHFKAVEHFGGMEGFQLRQKHDAMKFQYCQQHKIPLFYIRYDEDLDQRLAQIIQWYIVYKWMV